MSDMVDFDGIDNHSIGDDHGPGHIKTGFSHGDFVIKSGNFQGGHDTFVNGAHVTHTENNGIGGQNIYHGHELQQVAMDNLPTGMDIYDGHMHYQGTLMDDGNGGENYVSMTGNADTIMNYQDPLTHAAEYKMNPFIIGN